MPSIFISYRRKDSDKLASELARRVKASLGDDPAFFDQTDLELGKPWPEAIQCRLKQADILLVLVGPRWLDELLERRKSMGDEDWVYREVFTGLARGIRVVPVLFSDNERDPLPVLLRDQLPPVLRGFEELQRYELQGVTISRDGDGQIEGYDSGKANNIGQLVEALEQIPVFDVLRTGLESAYTQLVMLEDEKADDIRLLIEQLRQEQVTRADVSGDGDKYVINVYGNERERKQALVEIIKVVGMYLEASSRKLHDRDLWDAKHCYVHKQLENILETVAARLAETDTASKDEKERTFGCKGLLKLAFCDGKKKDAKDMSRAGQRGLAYYVEYHHPKLKSTDIQQEFAETHAETRLLTPDVWQRMWSSVHFQQLRDTWNEFVSEEAIGGALIIVLLALALAMHNLISERFMTLQPLVSASGAPNTCWYVSNQEPLFLSPCWRGVLADAVALAGAVGLAISLVQYFAGKALNVDKPWPKPLLIGLVLTLGAWVWVLFFDPLAKQFGGVPLWDFIVGFTAASVLTLPGSLVILAAAGWSSVIVGGRKTRHSPDVQLRYTWLAAILGMGVMFFFLAVVVEKSRPHWVESVFLGLCWGMILGVSIWASRDFFKADLESATLNPSASDVRLLVKRACCVIGPSIAFTLVIGMLSMANAGSWSPWPTYNQYVAIPAITNSSQNLASPTYREWFESSRIGIALDRLVMLGAWIGAAIFFGLEIMNNKMMNTGRSLIGGSTVPDSPRGGVFAKFRRPSLPVPETVTKG